MALARSGPTTFLKDKYTIASFTAHWTTQGTIQITVIIGHHNVKVKKIVK